MLVTESDVDRAERFLAGRGAWAIVVGRMLPFVRAFISIVAGLVRIPPIRFGVLSLIGTLSTPPRCPRPGTRLAAPGTASATA